MTILESWPGIMQQDEAILKYYRLWDWAKELLLKPEELWNQVWLSKDSSG
jgi:hypothetical protein